jgi:cytochrome c oxidase subunit 3
MALAEIPASHAPVADAPPAPPTRPRVVPIGAALAGAACLAFFLTMLGIYLQLRGQAMANGSKWLPDGAVIQMQQPNVMLFALLMSSVLIQWAVDAIKKDDRPQAYLALGLTELFGFAVLNMAAYYYSVISIDIGAATPVPVLIYTITGGQLLMLVAAMIFTGLMAFRALGGQYTGRQHDGMTAAAIFWHCQVVVFMFIWYAIYITK